MPQPSQDVRQSIRDRTLDATGAGDRDRASIARTVAHADIGLFAALSGGQARHLGARLPGPGAAYLRQAMALRPPAIALMRVHRCRGWPS